MCIEIITPDLDIEWAAGKTGNPEVRAREADQGVPLWILV